MKNKLGLVFCLSASFLFAGCDEVDITDGRVPAKYLKQASDVVGNYRGEMHGRPVTVSLKLDQDRLRMEAMPDLLATGCQSKVGYLTKIQMDDSDSDWAVEAAHFDFDAALCQFNITGKEVVASLTRENGSLALHLEILESANWREECSVQCSAAPRGGGCHPVCHQVPEQKWLKGDFVRIN